MSSVHITESNDLLTKITPIETIIEQAKAGKMYILVDDEDRENEGDLVIASEFADANAINFMATHGRGLICTAITQQRADELNIKLQERMNNEPFGTAFTTSIEAKEGVTTGISAPDRAKTVSVIVDATKNSNDIVTPGHTFPIIANEGGVLSRTGHTEATVDISRIAGLYPSSVICEIMNEDGTMARLPQVIEFAEKFGLSVGTIADLVEYRKQNNV
ncbi:MAG: 3,4-dihydroxy-2-butanone-4-phosphate synthase [Alphaproteobacteria bacterium]